MLDIKTIRTLSLIREIREPRSLTEKFHNSDKSWSVALLGKNYKAIVAAFTAIQSAKNLSTKV